MKQKIGRKLLGVLLTLTMVVGLLPGMGLTAYAAGGGTEVTQANVICQQYSYMDADGYSNTPPVDITNIALADAQAFGAAVNCQTTYWVVVYAKDGDNLKWTSNGKTGEQTSTPRSSSLSAWCQLYNDDVCHFGGNYNPYQDVTFYFSKGLATVGVTGVTLNKTETTLTVGGTQTLTATVSPDNATDKTVKWSTTGGVTLYSDENCTAGNEIGADATSTLTVYAKGISAGTATITVTSNADSEKSASCDVTVEKLLTTITATGKEQASYSTANVATVSFSYTAGGSSAYAANWGWWGYGWTATVNAAEGYTITKCVFYDDKDRTATDSETPFVVETAEGDDKAPKVNGTPILAYQSKGITKIEVYGYATPASTVAVTGVTLDKAIATLTVGGEETLTATVAPDNATNKAVTWASDNTSVATVDSNGKVTAVSAGTANITATSNADSTKTASCAVTVKTETLLTTVTPTGKSTYNETTSGVVTVSHNNDGYVERFGWLWIRTADTLTVSGCEGYTITKVIFKQNANSPVTDSSAPFELHFEQEPRVVCQENNDMNGITSIEVYGYANKAAQTITAENVTATYGDTGKSVSATTDGDGAISYAVKDGGDVIEVNSSTGALTIRKAGTATVTVTAAETDTYAQATKDVTVTVNKKALTIKAKDQSIYVGGAVPTLGSDSYTVTGLVGEDTLTTAPTLAYNETPDNTKAGTYTITPSGAAAGDNYEISYQNGTLTISVPPAPPSSDSDDSDDSDYSTPSSTTTTTTTDTTSNPDASTTDGAKTVTTTTNRDGSTTEKTTETATKSGGDGSKTEVKAESTTTTKSNRNGTTTAATTTTETATTTAADGTKTVTETKTEAKETLNKSGNGTVEAKTTETVKDESGKVTATTVTESKGTVETATDGTKTTTTTNTAVTTDAAGNKTTVVTTEKATVTTDGNTGKVVSDESGKVVSVEAKISETAAESAAKSGETVTLPVTVTAAQSAEDATAVAITVPKAAESVKVEIPVEDVKPGTVAVIVHEDGTEEIVKTSTTSEGGVVLALESGASVKVVDNTKTFDDVDDNEWYAGNVAWASSREVMNGVGNNSFAPNEDTNRAMVTQILYNLDDGKASGAVTTFNDVSADDWYADSVAWAVENGVARGEGESFGANDPVSREQLAVMLCNYAGKKGYDVSPKGDISRFSDGDSASPWASDALAWAVGVGIINGARDAAGNTLLDPQGNASRAQVTAMTERFCQKAAK